MGVSIHVFTYYGAAAPTARSAVPPACRKDGESYCSAGQSSPAFCLTAADWLTHAAPPETPGELAWQFNLATAALRFDRWTQDATVGESLCMCYLALSSTYLDNVYHAELLNEEDILILPGVHRFAWYF